MERKRNHRVPTVACIISILFTYAATRGASEPNAALLYNQAFLLYEKPDDTMSKMLADFRFGRIESNQLIREHIEKNHRVIDYVTTAASIPTCNWGYDYSQGLDLVIPSHDYLMHMAFLLLTEARLLAEQGDAPTALDRILTAYKMAMHSIDRPWTTYLIGQALACYTDRVTPGILPMASDNVEALSRLKAELRRINDTFPPLAQGLTGEGEICAVSMRKEKAQTIIKLLEEDRDAESYRPLDGSRDERMIVRIREADDTFFEANRKHWLNSIAAMAAILESRLPYPEMCAKLDAMDKQQCGATKDSPDGVLTAAAWPEVTRTYQLNTRLHTELNAIETAIDLYAARARTGRLPDMLPADAPLDLFTSQPFKYEKTADGFILAGRDRKMLERDKILWYQYEFKIKK